MSTFVRRDLGSIAVLLALLLVIACTPADRRTSNLRAGMSKDSVLAVMGGTAVRIDAYLIDGHYIEAVLFAREGAGGQSQSDRQLTPTIVIDGQLAGWGWNYWDSVAVAHKIEVAPKD